MLRLPLVIKNLYRKPFNGQLMVLATMCLSIIAMSLMGVTTIHRSMMIFELPKIVESTLQLQQCKFLASRIKIQYLVSFVSMGLLLRFETLIIPCSRFQSSSVIGLIVRMESKLMILGLPQLTSTKQLINQILSFQPPRLSKFSMYKMNLLQDGQLFYQLLNKTSWKWTRVMISWTTLLNTIQSFLLCHKLNHLMLWMTLMQYVCGSTVKGFRLRTNLICN